ncbi:hypothetical protein, partial [Gordonia sp. (in: high G+C Gram-positive bacteria)]|uniref:hypothetical protein n=1 Tax=Gordonia sp. (in: high G+C Gram-positive bacteria) TaxID=84139 RepID=UPI0039E4C023
MSNDDEWTSADEPLTKATPAVTPTEKIPVGDPSIGATPAGESAWPADGSAPPQPTAPVSERPTPQ